MNEERIETARFHFYNPDTVQLDNYDYVTLFLDNELIPRDHRVHVLVSRKEMLYLHNRVWNTGTVAKVLRYGIFHREKAVKKM